MKRTVKIFSYLIYSLIPFIATGSNIDTLYFKVNSEGFSLDVQIMKSNEKHPVPAIIFLTGTTGFSSHKSDYKDFTRYFIEKTFLENGFAVVYFDMRGVGDSEGIWYETTLEQRARDVFHVALALREFDFIQKEKIYLIGHSQGGWIAQMAVSDHPEIFAGGVSMAGPTFGVIKQLINDYMSSYICKKGDSEEKAFQKASDRARRDIYYANKSGKKGNRKQLKVIQEFEPKRYIFNLERPFLIMLAENDEQVNVNWAVDEIQNIFPSGKPSHIKIHIATSETHFFRKAHKCYNRDWKNVPFSVDSQKILFNWIAEKAK